MRYRNISISVNSGNREDFKRKLLNCILFKEKNSKSIIPLHLLFLRQNDVFTKIAKYMQNSSNLYASAHKLNRYNHVCTVLWRSSRIDVECFVDFCNLNLLVTKIVGLIL